MTQYHIHGDIYRERENILPLRKQGKHFLNVTNHQFNVVV